jgi:RNA polymerase sigma factor (TIGR02999 family)
MNSATELLSLIDQGHSVLAGDLLPLVYGELRKLAASRLAQEKPGQTLSPTGLVHEAFVRLVDVERAQSFGSTGHFFAAAAEAMRRILIESARRKNTQKRKGDRAEIDIEQWPWKVDASPDELLAIDEILDRLASEDAEAADMVKLRVFGGCSVEEAGQLLQISRTSAYRQWNFAKAWLTKELRD